MAFEPENELEKALLRAVKDPAAAADFFRLLLESNLLVLGTAEGRETASGAFNLAPGGRLNLTAGEKNGRKFLPIFTSHARMRAYVKQDGQYLSINGRALLQTTLGAPLTLNPDSEYAKDFLPQEIHYLLQPSALQNQPRVMVEGAQPAPLRDALAALFAARPEIAAAWMIQVAFADRIWDAQPLVGIETDGDIAALMGEMERAADAAAPGLVFDVQLVDRTHPAGMAETMLKIEPFYRRGQFRRGATLN